MKLFTASVLLVFLVYGPFYSAAKIYDPEPEPDPKCRGTYCDKLRWNQKEPPGLYDPEPEPEPEPDPKCRGTYCDKLRWNQKEPPGLYDPEPEPEPKCQGEYCRKMKWLKKTLTDLVTGKKKIRVSIE